MHKPLMARQRASFLTGLAVGLPGVITLAVAKRLLGAISRFTDILSFFSHTGWVQKQFTTTAFPVLI